MRSVTTSAAVIPSENGGGKGAGETLTPSRDARATSLCISCSTRAAVHIESGRCSPCELAAYRKRGRSNSVYGG